MNNKNLQAVRISDSIGDLREDILENANVKRGRGGSTGAARRPRIWQLSAAAAVMLTIGGFALFHNFSGGEPPVTPTTDTSQNHTSTPTVPTFSATTPATTSATTPTETSCTDGRGGDPTYSLTLIYAEIESLVQRNVLCVAEFRNALLNLDFVSSVKMFKNADDLNATPNEELQIFEGEIVHGETALIVFYDTESYGQFIIGL
jgi:hypothetical protein